MGRIGVRLPDSVSVCSLAPGEHGQGHGEATGEHGQGHGEATGSRTALCLVHYSASRGFSELG